MSWFEEQLKYRKQQDNDSFAESIDSVAGAVMGKRLTHQNDVETIAKSAIEEINKYYHGAAISGRAVKLDSGWQRHSVGAMLGTVKESGAAVALLPHPLYGYSYYDYSEGRKYRVTRRNASRLSEDATCYYEQFPARPLTVRDLFRFMFSKLSGFDIFLYFLLMIIVALLGLLSPMFTKWLFGSVLEAGSMTALIALAVFMVCFAITQALITTFQSLINARLEIKQNNAIAAAVMHRILNLPAGFFRDFSSGELTQRSIYVSELCSIFINTITTVSFTTLFSFIYVGQIFSFIPSLAVPSLLIAIISLLVSVVTTLAQMRITKQRMEYTAKTSGMTYSMITGIQKIKLAGAEKRMFARWANLYSKEAELTYSPPTFIKLRNTITLAISVFGTLFLYMLAIQSGTDVGNFYAFTTSYALVTAAFTQFSNIALILANIKPTYELAKPILNSTPEVTNDGDKLDGLRGEIELNNVSFRYDEHMPYVIHNLSLKIRPGEYIAVVGATGCGKSTLLRLLLGFETPQRGSIYYDKKDIAHLDIRELRRKVGVVMQDGKLFLGDIYSNIVISAPELTLSDAWEAAKIASIDEDIKRMPMGMQTLISEGQGGFSGGQKQRLMIARAVAPKPKILMFDEATSALDNVTQKKVADAIDSLGCTRIVIAHRLSTIKHCDRIIVLDHGNIVEQGTYDELIAQGGTFSDLVARQRIDIDGGEDK